MKCISDCRLYGILDLGYIPPAAVVEAGQRMIEGGVDIIQLRAKNYGHKDALWLARQVHPVTREAGVPLIINDLPEVAPEAGAEGVHVGQDDFPISQVHAFAGRRKIVGKSTHGIEQAVAAQLEDADYIGFGPVFSTPTKPDYQPIGLEEIRRVHELISIPIFCIGGIKLENLASVLAAGASRVVIVSGILKAPDIAGYCRDVKSLLLANRHPTI